MEEKENKNPTIAELEQLGIDYGIDEDGNKFYLFADESGKNKWYKITSENIVMRIK